MPETILPGFSRSNEIQLPTNDAYAYYDEPNVSVEDGNMDILRAAPNVLSVQLFPLKCLPGKLTTERICSTRGKDGTSRNNLSFISSSNQKCHHERPVKVNQNYQNV